MTATIPPVGKTVSSIAHILWIGKLYNMKNFAIICSLLFFAACRSNGFYQPYTMDMTVPDGPPEYRAGWRAGCRTGLAASSNVFFANSFVYPMDFGDGTYHHDSLFASGWIDSAFSCFEQNVTFTVVKGSFQGPLE